MPTIPQDVSLYIIAHDAQQIHKNWSSLTHQPEKSFQAQHSFLSFTVTILQGMGAEWDLSVLEQATVCLLAVEAQLGPTTWEQSYSII